MRLIVLSAELPPGPGGIGMHAHQLATAARGLGWDVTVVAPQEYTDSETRAAFNAGTTYEVVTIDRRGGTVRRALHRLGVSRRVLRHSRPDIVIASGEHSLWIAALLLRRRRPWIAFGHGTEFATPTRWRRGVTRMALRRARAVVCNSRFTQSVLMDLGVRGVPLHVIVPGADTDRYRPDPEGGQRFRESLGVDREPVVLTVGNVSARKGQDVIVRALADERLADLHYAVVGLPSTAEDLMTRARSCGVADRVHLLGALPTEDLCAAYNGADVFAMTSRHDDSGDFEGYGIAVIEAALCGRPALVSDGSGLAEAVEHDVTGLVVTADDVRATADGLVELLADERQRRVMGDRAEAEARRNNDWTDLIEAFATVIRPVVADPSTPPTAGTHMVVVSDTPHYAPAGGIVGWGPVVRELDQLAERIGRITHVAPVYPDVAPQSALPHRSDRIELWPVRPAGGPTIRAKLGVLARYPSWYRTVRRAARGATVIHVRAPSNVALLGVGMVALSRRLPSAWIKYGGNWQPDRPEPWSYSLQRRILSRGVRNAAVTVNGSWPGQPDHVLSLQNPTLDAEEMARGAAAARSKMLTTPFRLAYVGRLDRAKGSTRALGVALAMAERGVPVELHVVGDGPEGPLMRRRAANSPGTPVVFHGWLSRTDLELVYADSHFLLLPTDSEGFPKVVAEAMAFGAVPLTSAVSSIPATLREIGAGRTLRPDDIDGYADAIEGYIASPATWREERDRGVAATARFSYSTYLDEVSALLADRLGVDPTASAPS